MVIHEHTVRVMSGFAVVYGDDGRELGHFVRVVCRSAGKVEYRTARGSFATPSDAVLDIITAPVDTGRDSR